MFSALSLGSLVYILDKSERPKLKIGEVISVSQPKQNFNMNMNGYNQTVIDIKVNMDGNTFEYNAIPSNFSIVSYNNGKITISETKQGLLSEVENILHNSRLIVENVSTYKLNIVDCESILKELNPQFAKDKERDERLNTLELKFTGVENKIDKLLTLVTTKEL